MEVNLQTCALFSSGHLAYDSDSALAKSGSLINVLVLDFIEELLSIVSTIQVSHTLSLFGPPDFFVCVAI